MNDFISTKSGKIINLSNIAFLTSRINPKSLRKARSQDGQANLSYRVKGVAPLQLVVAFSAVAEAKSSMIPLSLILEGEEAIEFLDQLNTRGVNVSAIRQKLAAK